MRHNIKLGEVVTEQVNKIGRLWSDFMEALSGSEKVYTSGKIGKALFMLAIPMVLEMIFESVFAVADIFFVSKLGDDAVATVGITESIITIVYAIGFGLSMATTALVARRIGENKPEEASKVSFQAIVTGLFVSVFIAFVGIFYSKDLLTLMGANSTIVNEMSGYATIILGSNVIIMILFINNAIFRSAGDAALSMRVLIVANCLNLVLDPLLIFGWGSIPAYGVEGAAIATSLGRGMAVVYQFVMLGKGKGKIHLKWEHICLRWATIKQLVSLSVGGIGQNIIATSSWIGLMRIIAEFGSAAIAGYTIAIRILIFILLPSWGLSNAAATLVGQNLGANQPERAEKSVWAAGKINMVFLGLVGVVFYLFPRFFIELFTPDQSIVSNGIQALQIISLGFVFYGLGMVLLNAINGAGDTRTPTYFNLISFWIIEIPLAYFLAIQLGWDQKGVYYSIIISEMSLTLIAFLWFKQGRWKLMKV
ncbi:MATE family efflux transporter [Labilibaculum antarcticum]|uniref:Multidrug-efflux transporter n=1 Tax=Labilibaculum antarcticum TaxID=1717717 RepID=A0A1Y1CKC5_9BACT|nr:MATE family efflux transporter [Labilibaculum antarcticum]BAX80764.1 MATE family efflux transporter [Labilibaculum antarcticum]